MIEAETQVQAVTSNPNSNDLFACKWLRAPDLNQRRGRSFWHVEEPDPLGGQCEPQFLAQFPD
jgi:hypothetical protein